MKVLWLSVTIVLQFGLLTTGLFAEVRSIQEFNEFEEKWPKLTQITWNLEGRYGVISDQNMTFKNCKLSFVLADGVSRPGSNVSVVEVLGHLELDRNKKPFFLVTSLKSHRNDSETLRFKRGSITTTNAAEWYTVADWGKNRAEFYKDNDLMKEVQDLYRNGLLTEYRALERDDYSGLLALAEKARRLKLGEPLAKQFIHEALHVQSALVANKKSDSASLLNTLSKELPGSITPLDELPMPLTEQYRKDPIAVYEDAEDPQRKELHRIFYLDEMVKHILRDAKPDGSNGIEISRRLKAEVPERPDLVIAYHDKELEYRLSRVDVMTRNEVMELAGIFEDEGKTDKAITLKQSWLKIREPILAEDGARGYVELGQDWEDLLKDQETATKYYLLAARKDPQYHLAALWLSEHGFIQVNGKWMLEADAPPTNDVVMQRAIRDGRVTVGMTAEQALAAMTSKPDSVMRFASNGTTSELWVYESSQTTIRFARRPLGGSQVVDIKSIRK